MKVTIFTKSANDPRFDSVLRQFANGVRVVGDDVDVCEGMEYRDCDVAVFFGSWKNRNMPHHIVKNDIVSKAKNFIVLETPLLGRMPVKEIMQDNWYRIGLNGFLADTGNFNNKNRDSSRWETVQECLDIAVAPYTYKYDGPIILPLQLPGDASLRGASIEKWALETVMQIREITSRPVVIRTPQLERAFDKYYIKRLRHIPNVVFQQGSAENLVGTLSAAYCSVVYSSGFSIDSLVHGCPTIACSPSNFCYDLVDNTVENIEKVSRPDRTQLFCDLSYAQWHVAEIEKGLPWKHLKTLF